MIDFYLATYVVSLRILIVHTAKSRLILYVLHVWWVAYHCTEEHVINGVGDQDVYALDHDRLRSVNHNDSTKLIVQSCTIYCIH